MSRSRRKGIIRFFGCLLFSATLISSRQSLLFPGAIARPWTRIRDAARRCESPLRTLLVFPSFFFLFSFLLSFKSEQRCAAPACTDRSLLLSRSVFYPSFIEKSNSKIYKESPGILCMSGFKFFDSTFTGQPIFMSFNKSHQNLIVIITFCTWTISKFSANIHTKKVNCFLKVEEA